MRGLILTSCYESNAQPSNREISKFRLLHQIFGDNQLFTNPCCQVLPSVQCVRTNLTSLHLVSILVFVVFWSSLSKKLPNTRSYTSKVDILLFLILVSTNTNIKNISVWGIFVKFE